MLRQMIILILGLASAGWTADSHAAGVSADGHVSPQVWGVECGASDIGQAVAFYTKALGFELQTETRSDSSVDLSNGDFRLGIYQQDASLSSSGEAYVVLNMAVADLGAAVDKTRAHGAIIENATVRDFALGTYVEIRDPYGHRIHLLKLTGVEDTDSASPTVFNVGVTGVDLNRAEEFYTSLGFDALTRDYLPETLPLKQAGASMIVLHAGADSSVPSGHRNFRIVVNSDHPESPVDRMSSSGSRDPGESPKDSRILQDPSGNETRVISEL